MYGTDSLASGLAVLRTESVESNYEMGASDEDLENTLTNIMEAGPPTMTMEDGEGKLVLSRIHCTLLTKPR